jgi:N6-adenosine-specific RNA methylase IME4
LPVRHLLDDAAIGVIWVPNPLLAEGLHVLSAWGFAYKQIWPWVKTTQNEDRISDAAVARDGIPEDLAMAFLMGRIARYCSEVALVGTHGPIYQHLQNRSVRNVILAPKLPHSQKPEKVHDHLDVMFPAGERMELFARRQRRKKPRGGQPWACIGNEAPATKGRDIHEVLCGLLGRPLGAQMDLPRMKG